MSAASAVKDFFIGPPQKRPVAVDLILKYWRDKEGLTLPTPRIVPGTVLTSVAMGLGDTLMLTDLPKAAVAAGQTWTSKSNSSHFLPLMAYNPSWTDPPLADQVYFANAPCLIRYRDCGNGHYLQRIRRAFGLSVADVPKPYVGWTGLRKPNRVILHFDPGPHAQWQRQHVHPRARSLYPTTKLELEKFISVNKHLEFLIVGSIDAVNAIKGASFAPTNTLRELVDLVGSGGWFIGIMSGPLHLAKALGLKTIAVVNFPSVEQIVLPTLKQTHQVESEWFYPDNVHLHQEGASPLVPLATCQSLNEAFDGKVFPFWKTEHCSLIHEKL